MADLERGDATHIWMHHRCQEGHFFLVAGALRRARLIHPRTRTRGLELPRYGIQNGSLASLSTLAEHAAMNQNLSAPSLLIVQLLHHFLAVVLVNAIRRHVIVNGLVAPRSVRCRVRCEIVRLVIAVDQTQDGLHTDQLITVMHQRGKSLLHEICQLCGSVSIVEKEQSIPLIEIQQLRISLNRNAHLNTSLNIRNGLHEILHQTRNGIPLLLRFQLVHCALDHLTVREILLHECIVLKELHYCRLKKLVVSKLAQEFFKHWVLERYAKHAFVKLPPP